MVRLRLRHRDGSGIVLRRVPVIKSWRRMCLVGCMRLVLRDLWCHLRRRYVCRLECMSAILWNGDRGSAGAWRIVRRVGWRWMPICGCWLSRYRRKMAGIAHGDISRSIAGPGHRHHRRAANWFNMCRNGGSWFRWRRFLRGKSISQ